MDDFDTQNIELQLLFQAIQLRYGYDFRNYAKASIRRRVEHRLVQDKLSNISAMQDKLLYDETFFSQLLRDFSINVTEMFRDPNFYLAIRNLVIPELKKHPFLKIWHAGCASTGEEVYSKAGGRESFSDYYVAHNDHVILDKSLKKNILFSEHNLATDGVFGEMNLIMCRNVLIYFDRELQNRVFKLFFESLAPKGFLAIGSKESLRFSKNTKDFKDIVKPKKIYQ